MGLLGPEPDVKSINKFCRIHLGIATSKQALETGLWQLQNQLLCLGRAV